MNENLVGKVLKNENEEDYMVISVLSYKGLLCAYCEQLLDGKKGRKDYFQVTPGNDGLISIASTKILKALRECNEEARRNIKPRKIKQNEKISDYFNYLDNFYKSNVVNNM